MNRRYQSILNRRTGLWQVVSENTRHAGKTGNSVRKSVALLVFGMAVGVPAMADVFIDGGQTVSVPSSGQPSPWDVGGSLYIGDSGTGTLNIENGGQVTNLSAFLGDQGGSQGTATVTGSNSVWENSGIVVVGNAGTGTLTIENGGRVESFSGAIADSGNASSGTVVVTGAGSTWNMTSGLLLGFEGSGELTVEDGATVSASSTSLARWSGSVSTLLLAGSSTGRGMLQTGYLIKGLGTANVTIEGGVLRATADQTNFLIGFGSGSITLAGEGLFFDTNGNDVGINIAAFTASTPDTGILTKQGEGTLTLNGNSSGVLQNIVVQEDTLIIHGEISNAGTYIDYLGGDTDKTATLIVSGTGAKLESSTLHVADAGTGSLRIENGATVTVSGNTILGDDAGGHGTAIVTGTGSVLNTSSLMISNLGKGTLEISAGGKVMNQNWGYIGYDDTGAVTVTGNGSRWENGGGLYVGDFADGTLTIADGGVVTNAFQVDVGYGANATGIVTVTGANSLFDNAQKLYVGNVDTSTGILNIENGGKVKNTTGYIGYGADATGTVTVTGASSLWENSQNLQIGFDGTGTLEIKDGGKVSNAAAFIGGGIDSVIGGFIQGSGNGTVSVTGVDSTWQNTGPLYVGLYGSGTLNIAAGGSVSDTYGYVGAASGGVSTATVTGAGSIWSNTSRLYVGDAGNGTLNIQDGGKVTADDVYLAATLSASGTLNLDGTDISRGILSTSYLVKGSGAAIFNWNGGILQASNGTESLNLIRGFSAGDITINSNGAFIDTQAFDTAIQTAGVLTGTGGLTKLGSGELTIAGGNTYAGNTTVSAGTLRFDTYTQSASQTLGIGAVNVNTYGKLDVTGSATFNANANIDVDVASPLTPALGVGNVLTGVITAGTLNANGFSVTDNSSLFNFIAQQNDHSVDLRIVASSASGIRDAVIDQGHWSALGAADVLDVNLYNGATGDMGNVISALGQLSGNRDIARAANQTLPVISGNQAIQGTLSTFQKLVQNRSGNNAGTTGLSSGDALINKNGWAKVFGSRAEQDDRSGASGFKADTWGLALGGDAEVAPGARFGLAYGYAKTSVNGNTDLSGTAQRANIDSHIVSAYGSKDIGGNRTFSFQGDIGVNSNKSTRQIDFGGLNRTARADYRTYSAHVGAAIAQAFELNEKTTLTPALRADYTWLKSQSYNETGADALNLNVGSNKTDAFVIGADAYLQHRFSQTSRIDANFGVGYDTINEQGNIVAAYAGAPGQSFVTTGIDHSPWLMRGGIGYSMTAASGTEVSFRYDAESRSDFLNHTASVRAKWAF